MRPSPSRSHAPPRTTLGAIAAALVLLLAACPAPAPETSGAPADGKARAACATGAAGCPCDFTGVEPTCAPGLRCLQELCFGGDVPAPDSYHYTERAKKDEELINQLLADRISLAPGMRVADIGAGTGFFTLHAARRVTPGGRVIATDIDPDVIATLKASIRASPQRGLLERAIEQKLVTAPRDTGLEDLPDAFLDLVVMFRVLTFFEDNRADDLDYLRRIHRKIRPGGRFAYHMDWVNLPGHQDYLVSLFRDAGFTGKIDEIPMPDHIPAVAPRHEWDAASASEPMIPMYRGFILVFRKPGTP